NLIGLSGQVCASAGTQAQSAARASRSLRRRMTHGFDVVTVRIEHERAVVVGVIVRTQSRRPVVLAAGREGGLVERVDLRARLGAKRHVDMRYAAKGLAHPEVGLGWYAETRGILELHDDRIAERRERRTVERLALRYVGNRNAGVIDHRSPFLMDSHDRRPGTRAAPSARACGFRPRPRRRSAARR